MERKPHLDAPVIVWVHAFAKQTKGNVMNVAIAAKHGAKEKAMPHRANYAQQSPELLKKFTEFLAAA